jgi:phenylalanyl-tRNA synthetase alpha chain
MTSELRNRVTEALETALAEISSAGDSRALKSVGTAALGKKGALAVIKAELSGISDLEVRKELGRLVGEALATVSDALSARSAELESVERDAQVAAERLDLTEFVEDRTRGHAHIVTTAMARLEDVFIGLGFEVAEGPEVELDFYNFEALNMPKSHPARSEFDTMFIEPMSAKQEPGSVLLRTHTSPVQIRLMQKQQPPIYAVMPGRVFRRDTPDATHMPVFHQIEGLVVDEGITFAHLAGTIEAFTKAFFGSDFTSRLRPSFFPFTEPSAEFDIRRKDGEWIELGGCGMVHPNVLRAGGVDPERYTGFAFGFGIDRMAKERHHVADLRDMYSNDLRFLRQFP